MNLLTTVRKRPAWFLGLIAVVFFVAGGGLLVWQVNKTAMVQSARKQATEIQKACEAFAADHQGMYPAQLTDLLKNDEAGGPYLKSSQALLDPWCQPYQYDINPVRRMGEPFTPGIWTTCPDGQEIGNW
jgi:hypothetical protein